MHAPQYRETLFSHLYPGNTHSNPAYIPTVDTLSTFLAFSDVQKQRSILRTDSGFGCDYNLNYALDAHYQVLSKSYGGRRSASLARKITSGNWMDLGNQRWVTPAVDPPGYNRDVQNLVLRWKTERGEIKHSVLVCSILDWSMQQVVWNYDDRAGCETEIQADKSGLKIEKRRKMSLAAQEALILITDLAHNVLSWASNWMFSEGDHLATFGKTRLIEDFLAVQGRLIFDTDRLKEIQLNELHPHADQIATGLERLLDHFGNP